jgi:asparagine synthase (glutamine-hydrolysing)
VVIDGHLYNRSDWGPCSNDAALFLQLYQKFGFTEAVKKINGDFAIALLDANEDCLWLSRDRIGLKPLYYSSQKDFFGFASRPKALFDMPGTSKEVNREFVALFAASHYRYFDNRPEKSPFKDIMQLQAGHVARFKAGSLTISRYWDLHETQDRHGPVNKLAEQYRDLLLDSVAIRFQSAKRPAFTLSGGMDSSSVLASAVRFSGEKQHAFSTVYKDKTYDESAEISSMLAANVKEWHAITLDNDPDVLEIVRNMIALHD